jgi:predicted MFS family arabinose efflux permease
MDTTPGLPTTPRTGPFLRLAWSNLAAQSAEQIALSAAAIVAVVLLGATEGRAGLLQVALTLPYLLFALPAGVLVDRMARARLMIGAELLRGAAIFCVFVLIRSNTITWTSLAVLGFLAACGTVVFSVATPALVPALVDRADLATANARLELARTVAFTVGPALGGLLLGWTGAGAAFVLAALLSVISGLLLIGIQETRRDIGKQANPLEDVKEGLRFVAEHEMLRPIFITQFIFNTAYFVKMAVFVPYAVRHLGLSESGIGVTLGLYGGGMVVGALLAPMLMRRLRFGTIVGLGPIAGLVAALIMALTIWMPLPSLAALSFVLLGAGPILWVISTTTLRQSVTPPDLLGRVSAVNILAYAARPLGAGLGALIGWQLGAEACLLVAVVGFAIQAAVIWVSPVVALQALPTTVAT